MSPSKHRERALSLLRAQGMVRAREFRASGIPLAYLKRLTDAGELIRLGRGLYQDPERVGEDVSHDLAEAARLVPHGVISLASALRYHQITTQLPHVVWMTIPHRARTPSRGNPRIEVVRATGGSLSAGIEHVRIEGVDVPVYGVAKTVADCFKHRRLVGEDVAIEALRIALQQRKATPGELMAFAAIDRVSRHMEPLIKAIE